MPVVAKRYKVKFEERSLSFAETFPPPLEGALTVAEFDSVIRRINEDLAHQIKVRDKKVARWAYTCLGLSLVLMGLCLTPVLFVQTRRQRRELKLFWERVRNYLGEINRKTYLKRNLEWKLVEDKHKLKTRDVVNPLLSFRIELIHRTPRAGKKRPGIQMEDSGPGISAASTVGTSSTIGTGTGSGSGSGSGGFLFDESKKKRQSAISISTLASTEPGTASKNQAKPVAVLAGAGALTAAGAAAAASRSDDEDSDRDEEEEDLVVEEEEPSRIQRRNSAISDEIILEDIDAEEEGDHESGNLASNSSTGAGSYNRESLIINPVDAAVASAVLAKAAEPVEHHEEEKEPSIQKEEITEKETPKEEEDAPVNHRPSRVRFSSLFASDEDEEQEANLPEEQPPTEKLT